MWSCRVLKMKAAKGAGLSAILARASSKSVYVRIGRMGPSVDPADHLMAGYTRPGDRERAGDRPSVAMTDPTSLDTDADIAGRRFAQRLCREFKPSRRDRLDRAVGGGVVGHQNSLLLSQPAWLIAKAGCSTMRVAHTKR